MSDPALFLRRSKTPPPVEAQRIVAAVLLREAETHLAAGDRLVDGRWQRPGNLEPLRAERARRRRRAALEAGLFWLLVALIGLAFVGLAALLV